MKWYWKWEGKKYFEYSLLLWDTDILEGYGPSVQNNAYEHILKN